MPKANLMGATLFLMGSICSSTVALACGDFYAGFSKAAVAGELMASVFTWNTVAPSPIKRFEAQGAVVNGKLYIFGGYNASIDATTRSDVYDPATNRWRRIANMPRALTHSAVVADGQTIYVIGGFVGDHPGPSIHRVWKYSVGTNRWSTAPSLPTPRGAGAAVRLGRTLHFFGGANREAGQLNHGDKGDHYVLSLDGGKSWQRKASMLNSRNHLGGAVLGNKIYAIGGQHGRHEEDSNQSQVDAYNPATNTWKRVKSLPVPRGHISSSTFVLDNRIFVIGGTVNGGSNGLPAVGVTAYNPRTNAWVSLAPLPAGRKSPVAGAVGEWTIVSTGNATSGAAPTSTTWTRRWP